MKRYRVKMKRTITQYTNVFVDAEDIDEAVSMAEELAYDGEVEYNTPSEHDDIDDTAVDAEEWE